MKGLVSFANCGHFHFTKREMQGSVSVQANLSTLVKGTGLVIGLGFLFAWLGVYGSNDAPFLLNWAVWTMTMALGFGTAYFVIPWSFERDGTNWPLPVQMLVSSALISLPITAGLLLYDGIDGRVMPVARWPRLYLDVLLISTIMTVVTFFIYQAVSRQKDEDAPGAAQSDTEIDATDAFLQRLPARYRGAALYAVSSEDHYLRVHTDRGEELILMRLADAVRELEGADGLQVHRSWWVARRGIEEVQREGGKLRVRLKSGAEAPVSRTFAPKAREAGWLS